MTQFVNKSFLPFWNSVKHFRPSFASLDCNCNIVFLCLFVIEIECVGSAVKWQCLV